MFGKVEELAIVLIIVLVLFGAKKLPELSKGIAQSVREVRKGFKDEALPEPKAGVDTTSQKA
ncbi:MAG TPA: twin-arginine translocase TatA/TatE family subunit [Candidatus Saccharimonadia bacterium]|nr:twin-arginine translocase TatA/TatE family subunit [Candidatus Saccharimonadia bacterium]